MTTSPSRGRIYRRCGCRSTDGRQIGSTCPQLRTDEEHGSWAYAVDLPSVDGRRKTRRRGGYRTYEDALYVLEQVLSAERTGVFEDPKVTVGAFLLEWLALKERTLKASTAANYHDAVHRDLLPVFGAMRLSDLRSRHIEEWVASQLLKGRGRVAVYRAAATLRSALGAAVRSRRLVYNPALYAVMARPASPERTCWTPRQAAAFLRHNADCYADQLRDFFELLLGTGLRRGEALGLHWADVHLMERKLFVRWTLATVNNNQLHLGPPKTKASRNWVSLSPRVVAALRRQADYQRFLLPPGAPLEGLVFAMVDGAPLRPQWVLDQLRRRSAEAGVPRIGLHDVRHTAATIMISEGVSLAVVSKALRHSTLSTTINIYGHLLKHAADDAVNALSGALDLADIEDTPDTQPTDLGNAA
ncbi:integrase [Streptacidiphilus sp. MAP12-16]|uniref:tyrosine-type recombinase/integrase n=1 Tax=Streptacidiphilus sp. MAP12-16 TaxID=3156300 RepID=UPI003513329F